MLKNEAWPNSDYRKVIKLTILLVLSTIVGCGGGGESSPITSNLSTTPSTEADSSSAETDQPSSDVASLPDEPHAGDAEASVEAIASALEEEHANLTADSQPGLTDSGTPESQAEENPPPQAPTGTPVVALSSTPTGASANVTWQPSPDSNVSGYYIYYGRQPSGEPGTCGYEERYAVDSSSITIMDLEPNTPYFFAVSSYSSHESPCSNEIAIVTPPARA